MRVSADVDERTLREIYLPAFERVVTQAQPWTVMCSYNQVNGVYASAAPLAAHRGAARRVGLRGARRLRLGRRRTTGSPALAAGLDLEMPPQLGRSDARGRRRGARRRRSTRRCSTRPSRRVLDARRPGARRRPTAAAPLDVDAHHALAREAAARVRGAAQERRRPAAAATRAPASGRGHRRVRPHPALPGRRQLAGQPDPRRRRARRAARAGVPRRASRRLRRSTARPADEARSRRPSRRGGADVVVLFLGLPGSAESEGFDRDAHRPARRPARAARRGRGGQRRVVVVLSNGSASCDSRRGTAHAGASLEGWLLGQAGGGAVADLLLGAANPSGRLAETIPLRLEDNPVVPRLPGRLGPRPLRRGRSSSATAATTARAAGRLPVRPRPVLHDVRLRRPRGRPSRAATPTATCASGSAAPSPTPATARAPRWRSSTSPTSSRRSRDRPAS